MVGRTQHFTLTLGFNPATKSPQMQYKETINGVTYKYVYDIIGDPRLKEITGLFVVLEPRYKSPTMIIMPLKLIEQLDKKWLNIRKENRRRKYIRKKAPPADFIEQRRSRGH